MPLDRVALAHTASHFSFMFGRQHGGERMKRRQLLSILVVGLSGIAVAQTPDASQEEPLTYYLRATEEPQKRRAYVPRYGMDLGYLRLVSSRTRRVFGNTTLNFSPGFGPVSERAGLSIRPDVSIFNASRKVNGESNKLFTVTVGPVVRYTLAFPTGPGGPGGPGEGPEGEGDGGGPPGGLLSFLTALSPYVELGLGLTYADITARSEDISGKRFAYSTSIALGTAITNRAFVQVRYRFVPSVLSFDTSSVNFEFGLRF